MSYMRKNFKKNEAYEIFYGERTVKHPWKMSDVTLLHLMRYKP